MSRDIHEPVEVTLSSTQIAAFAGLLAVAMAGAFAAGAWWGQANAERLAGEPGEEPRGAEPAALAVEPPAPGRKQGSAEVVRFFGAADDGDAAAGVEPGRIEKAAFVVQVFSSAEARQAASVEQKLRADGHRAFVSPQSLDGQVMQRVRVGPFDDQAAAEAAAEQLAKQYGLETWITPNH